MKKLFTAILLGCFLFLLSVQGFALNAQEKYTYVESDGTILEYYKDTDGHPYKYEQGKKIYLLLNLEENLVTEEELFSKYGFEANNIELSPAIQTFGNSYTVLFQNTINFVSSSYQSGYLSYPTDASYLHLNINSPKPWYANNNVNLILVWRSRDDGKLYSEQYKNQNIAIDKNYAVSGRAVSEVRIGLVTLGAMTSCELVIRSATVY